MIVLYSILSFFLLFFHTASPAIEPINTSMQDRIRIGLTEKVVEAKIAFHKQAYSAAIDGNFLCITLPSHIKTHYQYLGYNTPSNTLHILKSVGLPVENPQPLEQFINRHLKTRLVAPLKTISQMPYDFMIIKTTPGIFCKERHSILVHSNRIRPEFKIYQAIENNDSYKSTGFQQFFLNDHQLIGISNIPTYLKITTLRDDNLFSYTDISILDLLNSTVARYLVQHPLKPEIFFLITTLNNFPTEMHSIFRIRITDNMLASSKKIADFKVIPPVFFPPIIQPHDAQGIAIIPTSTHIHYVNGDFQNFMSNSTNIIRLPLPQLAHRLELIHKKIIKEIVEKNLDKLQAEHYYNTHPQRQNFLENFIRWMRYQEFKHEISKKLT